MADFLTAANTLTLLRDVAMRTRVYLPMGLPTMLMGRSRFNPENYVAVTRRAPVRCLGYVVRKQCRGAFPGRSRASSEKAAGSTSRPLP